MCSVNSIRVVRGAFTQICVLSWPGIPALRCTEWVASLVAEYHADTAAVIGLTLALFITPCCFWVPIGGTLALRCDVSVVKREKIDEGL